MTEFQKLKPRDFGKTIVRNRVALALREREALVGIADRERTRADDLRDRLRKAEGGMRKAEV